MILDGFKWRNYKFNFDEDLKAMVKVVPKNASFKSMLIILRNYRRHIVNYSSYNKEWKLINTRNTAQKIKFSIKDFFNKYDQVWRIEGNSI